MDEYSLPAGIIRHFDLTSIHNDDSIQARRAHYPGGLLLIDRLLSLAGIDGKLSYTRAPAKADTQDRAYTPQLPL